MLGFFIFHTYLIEGQKTKTITIRVIIQRYVFRGQSHKSPIFKHFPHVQARVEVRTNTN